MSQHSSKGCRSQPGQQPPQRPYEQSRAAGLPHWQFIQPPPKGARTQRSRQGFRKRAWGVPEGTQCMGHTPFFCMNAGNYLLLLLGFRCLLSCSCSTSNGWKSSTSSASYVNPKIVSAVSSDLVRISVHLIAHSVDEPFGILRILSVRISFIPFFQIIVQLNSGQKLPKTILGAFVHIGLLLCATL